MAKSKYANQSASEKREATRKFRELKARVGLRTFKNIPAGVNLSTRAGGCPPIKKTKK